MRFLLSFLFCSCCVSLPHYSYMELEEFLSKLVNDFMNMWEVVFYESFLFTVDSVMLVLPRL